MTAQHEMSMNNADIHYKDWPNTAGFNASQDHREQLELKVTGDIPSYAAGVLYRTGPGGYKVAHNNGVSITGHWFDGYTITHRFEISAPNGQPRVSYSSRGQVDELLEDVRRKGHRDGLTFGAKRDPCEGLFQKFKSTFFAKNTSDIANSANIGVALRDPLPCELAEVSGDLKGRKIMTVTTDSASVKQFDAETLEPLGVTDQKILHPALKGPLSAAHAAHDPKNGDIFNYNLQLGASATYRIFRASPSTGKVDILATITGSGIRGSYLHSMFITENYVVLCVWPACYKASGLSILYNQNILDAIEPIGQDATTKWYVVDRRSGRGLVKSFESGSFFCFHSVNAWEDAQPDGTTDVVCELVQYKDLSILHKFYYENLVSDSPGVLEWNERAGLVGSSLTRYKLRTVPSSGQASGVSNEIEQLFSIGGVDAGDLPRINPHYATKPHRFVWTAAGRDKSSFLDALAKTDTRTGTIVIWEHEKHTPGEPIFIPRPGATEEDDGVVLVVVLDGPRGTSYLLCLDAATMKEISRADVGYPVGFGFHGMFVAKQEQSATLNDTPEDCC